MHSGENKMAFVEASGSLKEMARRIKEAMAVVGSSTIDIQRLAGIMAQPVFIVHLVVLTAMFVLMLIWLFNAVRVSCNLQGGRLWAVYLVGIIGGDLVCKLLVKMLY